ncbi:methyltransferase domain-containing protein [Winogradskyella sp.]|uniref:methyltransferase domain-containing protein n=1 Tax=Winogradskyella sp. TaxID=1883156 RepID=UPI003BABCBAC
MNLFDINSIGSIASIVVGVPTIIYWIVKGINNWYLYKRSKNVKDGIYQAYWIDPQNKLVNCEVLILKKTYRGFKAKPIYIHKDNHDYTLRAIPFTANKFIYSGSWKARKRTAYKGSALFHLDYETNTFTGKWLGPRRSGQINGGEWIIKFKSEKNSFFKSKIHNYLGLLQEKWNANESIISDIIVKHEKYDKSKCQVSDIVLGLNKDSFIPTLGKVSIPFIEYVAKQVKTSDLVLDLGTGTGFYPIYLAYYKKCKVFGADITATSINLAKNNARTNSVSEYTDFILCDKKDLFSNIDKNEQYDLIIANLPFSALRNTYKTKKSSYMNSFCGSKEILQNLILGSQFHIKPHGKLIFCYGDSGYKDFLVDLIEISSWKYLKEIQKIETKDEVFYIYELELNDFVQNAYRNF